MDAVHGYCDSFGLHWNALGTKFQIDGQASHSYHPH